MSPQLISPIYILILSITLAKSFLHNTMMMQWQRILCNAGEARDTGWIPGSERSPGEGNAHSSRSRPGLPTSAATYSIRDLARGPLHAGPPHLGCDWDPGASHPRSSPGSLGPRAGCPGLEPLSSKARRAELSEARSPSVLGPGQGTFPFPGHRLGHPGPFIPRDSGWWWWWWEASSRLQGPPHLSVGTQETTHRQGIPNLLLGNLCDPLLPSSEPPSLELDQEPSGHHSDQPLLPRDPSRNH